MWTKEFPAQKLPNVNQEIIFDRRKALKKYFFLLGHLRSTLRYLTPVSCSEMIINYSANYVGYVKGLLKNGHVTLVL
jgi:hypothetical protein